MGADYTRLLTKTQVAKSSLVDKVNVLGATEVTKAIEGDTVTDLFDDSDFYVTLLRDVAASRTDYGADSSTGDLFQLNPGRREKQQKSVERRASKGRMIRYVPIPQLLGFMTAVPRDAIDTEEQEKVVDQLVESLFQ